MAARGVGAGKAGDVAGVNPEGLARLDLTEVAVNMAVDDDIDARNFAAVEAGGVLVARKAEVMMGKPEDQG